MQHPQDITVKSDSIIDPFILLIFAGLPFGGPVAFSVAQYDHYKTGTGAEGGAVGAGHNQVTRFAGVRPTARAVDLELDNKVVGWKMGLTSSIAIMPPECFELVDGLIVN